MGFTKPYTYVNDTVLSATDHASNEDKLRSYVNQEIEDTDVDTDTIIGESIATPRFVSSVQTADFVSKTLQGVSKLRLPQEFNWFTATTKSDDQTSTTVEDYQTLSNAGAEVVILKDSTKIMITFYATAFGQKNTTVTYSKGNRLWDNLFALQYEKDGIITRYNGTRAYVFQDDDSSGVTPVAGNPDPGEIGSAAGHRSIMMTRMLTLSAGRYKFSVAVNAKVEKGNISCQSFTIETFHV
jgi:hypothetical protein